jgi:hypothetical protein
MFCCNSLIYSRKYKKLKMQVKWRTHWDNLHEISLKITYFHFTCFDDLKILVAQKLSHTHAQTATVFKNHLPRLLQKILKFNLSSSDRQRTIVLTVCSNERKYLLPLAAAYHEPIAAEKMLLIKSFYKTFYWRNTWASIYELLPKCRLLKKIHCIKFSFKLNV